MLILSEVKNEARFFELVRILLMELEGEQEVDLSSYNPEQVNYHKALVKEAGFTEGIIHYPSIHPTDIPDLAILKRLRFAHEVTSRLNFGTYQIEASLRVREALHCR